MNEQLLWYILLFPLLAFLLNGLAGRWLKGLGGWIAFAAMVGSAAISANFLFTAWTSAPEHHAAATHAVEEAASDGEDVHAEEAHAEESAEHAPPSAEHEEALLPLTAGPLWDWISVGSLHVSIGLHYDQLTAVMCFIITFVGSLVFLYSIGYMRGDPGFNRFFTYLSLFVFAMLILVLADNLLLLFVGWEGVGLCSYLLIGYYLDMPGAPSAGKKAFIVNRVGDLGFLLAMFLIFKYCGTLNIAAVVQHASEFGTFEYGGLAVTLITMLIFLGCTGKSAQIPLFVWLPDAMAGPTPVSALIHAATMVTAGVYLVVRTSALFALAPMTMTVMALIGALTAFVAGTIALTQRDIKKVLAYSTVSQLGYMFLACGVGAFAGGIFHVFTHAFFKGCLFLGAGAVIHSVAGNQDMFVFGGLRKKLPVTSATFFWSCMAIAGFPLMAGFFSKDEILWMTFRNAPDSLRFAGINVIYVLGVVTALMTAVYSFRAYFMTFRGESRLPEPVRSHVHAPDWTMRLPLAILALGAIGVGFFNVPSVLAPMFGLGEGANFHHFLTPVVGAAEHILATHPVRTGEVPGHRWELALTIFSAGLAVLGIGIAWFFTLKGWPNSASALADRFRFAYQLSSARWWWDEAYNFVFAGGVRVLGRIAVWIDQTLIDGVLHLCARAAQMASAAVRNLQMGQVQAYALIMLIGLNILLFVVFLW